MFRTLLPVLLCLGLPCFAEGFKLPGIGTEKPAAPICQNIPGDQNNCVRVLACIGSDGLYFDGAARGWDQGIVTGATSEGIPCAGHWRSGGFLGSGTSQMRCEDGLGVDVLYYTQDGVTGTVIGRGTDSLGRAIIVWTGENVLKYLTPEGRPNAELPCGPTPIPVS
ncbi:hypothetical protein [Pacificoceanicola onchidii]|uniref:hypothetical protein n=1 Tax=Pacificoceanicola onchidii TaxID=2562685 RepID=UPI0010A3999C|nr:hypothetical protein [Pacificoceanicola onchidii]